MSPPPAAQVPVTAPTTGTTAAPARPPRGARRRLGWRLDWQWLKPAVSAGLVLGWVAAGAWGPTATAAPPRSGPSITEAGPGEAGPNPSKPGPAGRTGGAPNDAHPSPSAQRRDGAPGAARGQSGGRVPARDPFALPDGSVSLGTTSNGSVVHARALPARGPGWVIIDQARGRHTNWGTDELVGLVVRVAKRVRRRHRGAVLGVANMGARRGGHIRWSVSHRAGRDVDLALFARDRRRRAVAPRRLLSFRRNGWTKDRRYRFDVARNFALIRALLEDAQGRVQWIFLADFLKQRILRYGRRRHAPARLLRRMDAVVKQPSDSTSHADHLHVRVQCSVEDRLYGCLDMPPLRPWIHRGERAFAARVATLGALAGDPSPRVRRRALRALLAIRAPGLAGVLLEALQDPARPVRTAAYAALKRLPVTDPGALDDAFAGVRRVLRGLDAGAGQRAADLLALLGLLRPERAAKLGRAILDPRQAARQATLGEAMASDPPPEVRVAAVELVARAPSRAAALALRRWQEAADRRVRAAVHAALRAVTNQPIRGDLGAGRAAARARAQQGWARFWRRHGDEPYLQWLRLGFEARGFRFRGRMMSRRSIPELIRAVGHRDEVVSANARRVLERLTGRAGPRGGTAQTRAQRWRRWWRAHQPRRRHRASRAKRGGHRGRATSPRRARRRHTDRGHRARGHR